MQILFVMIELLQINRLSNGGCYYFSVECINWIIVLQIMTYVNIVPIVIFV